jgi:hypothetical protein
VKGKLVEALRQAGLAIEECRIDDVLVSGFNKTTFKDKKSAYTVDIIFSTSKLDKQPATVGGAKTFLRSSEGLIAVKLRMIKAMVPRERVIKDEEDVRAILAFTKVDLAKVKQAQKDYTLEILKSFAEV